MERRLRALVRKSKPSPALAAVADELVKSVCTTVSTKRQYEELFEDAGTAEAFALRHSLSDPQRELLILMQEHKDIFVPNVWLDWLLTLSFMVECFVVGRDMHKKGMLLAFAGALLLTDAVISRVKFLAAYFGRPLSQWLYRNGYVDSDPLAGRIQMKKWQEQSWQLFVHIVFSLAANVIFLREPWYDDTTTMWRPHPYVQVHSLDVQVVYVAALSVWMYTCFVHRFIDERRRDYFVMFLHHVVTISLVGTSWAAQYLRIGILVMYVHDASDVFVDLLKMVNYLRLEGRRGVYASEIAYVLCIVTWIYYRLYRYPFKVLYSVIFEVFSMLAPVPRPKETFLGFFPPDLPWYTEMNFLLVILQFMHLYWFYLLAMVGYRIMSESAREASRQEYEGDSDDGEIEPGMPASLEAAPGTGRGPKGKWSDGEDVLNGGTGSSTSGGAPGPGLPPRPRRQKAGVGVVLPLAADGSMVSLAHGGGSNSSMAGTDEEPGSSSPSGSSPSPGANGARSLGGTGSSPAPRQGRGTTGRNGGNRGLAPAGGIGGTGSPPPAAAGARVSRGRK